MKMIEMLPEDCEKPQNSTVKQLLHNDSPLFTFTFKTNIPSKFQCIIQQKGDVNRQTYKIESVHFTQCQIL